MGNCFTCGRQFKGNENDLLWLFKRDYIERGIERYFYRLTPKGELRIVKKAYFNDVFNNEIKPNLINGAEYAHISEYKAV